MKREDLVTGRIYWVNHNGSKSKVRLLHIHQRSGGFYGHAVTRYECLKISTGRNVTFKSALKFIHEAEPSLPIEK